MARGNPGVFRADDAGGHFAKPVDEMAEFRPARAIAHGAGDQDCRVQLREISELINEVAWVVRCEHAASKAEQVDVLALALLVSATRDG